MSHDEGVIKFKMEYAVGPALAADALRELNAWRRILVLLEMIGQTPERYAGYGFGNISCRVPPWNAPAEQRRFVITGSQTGHVAHLKPEHFVLVTACYPVQNLTVAEGPIQPSSESMTHGAVYALDSGIRWVMHGHAPEIWHNAERLAIPTTRAAVQYGTPEMSAEVARLYSESDLARRRLFAMGGHEDGVVSFGRTAAQAGNVLIAALADAMYT
jgi:ribulose-5-phosphate 4-epimerase/fuculose-1-phosphate aldolase